MSWRIEHRGVLVASGTKVAGPPVGDHVWRLGGRITWGEAEVELRRKTTFQVELGGIILDLAGAVTMQAVGPDGTPRTLELRGRVVALGDVVLDVR